MLSKFFKRRALHKAERELARAQAAARATGAGAQRTNITNLSELWGAQLRVELLKRKVAALRAEVEEHL